jgi:hypothetical protein
MRRRDPSDFASEDGRVFGGLRGRAEYQLMIKGLREAWTNLIGAVDRNENVGAPTITALFDLVYNFLERSYGRFVIILAQGRLWEEVLANVARQLVELRLYFATFQRNLFDRCTRKPDGELAQFAGSQYIRLLGPAVRFPSSCSTWTAARRATSLLLRPQAAAVAAAAAAVAVYPRRRHLRSPGASSGSLSRTAAQATSRPRRLRSFTRPIRPTLALAVGQVSRTTPRSRRHTSPRRARPMHLPATTPSCPRLGALGGAATLAW